MYQLRMEPLDQQASEGIGWRQDQTRETVVEAVTGSVRIKEGAKSMVARA